MPQTDAHPFLLLQKSKACTSWAWGPVIISIWHGKPEANDIKAAANAHQELEKKITGEGPRILTLTLIEEARGISLDNESKKMASRFREELAASTLAGAVVIEGTGFFPSLVQAIYAGITILQKKYFPEKIFRNNEAAAAFLSKESIKHYAQFTDTLFLELLYLARENKTMQMPAQNKSI